MTIPPPRPGRRDNGLRAADWGALVDLDPRLGEGLLDRLAEAGVPAYVEPANAADPFSRATLPSRPLDRLWVDPDRADRAREVVAAEVAELTALLAEVEPGANASGLVQPVPRHAARRVLAPPPLPDPPRAAPGSPPADPAPPAQPRAGRLDDDELFRQIVAGWDRPEDSPVPRWPVPEDDDPGDDIGTARRQPPPAGRSRPHRRKDDPALPAWLEPPPLEEPARDGGHYVPPPPPPAPRLRLRTVAAVLTLLLGLVLVFLPGLLDQRSTPGSLLLGAALLVGGAGVLVWSVRDAPPTESGPDDGAVV